MSMDALVELSVFYGNDPEYVLAGGGNTSWKDADTLYVKGSGFPLAGVSAASFVKMDQQALALIWEKSYPEADADDPFGSRRESAVLSDMMAARKPGEEQKRPSVETLVHGLLPFSFVVHLHPALVNGLLCSQGGEAAVNEIFGEAALWIPSTNPGYELSKKVKTAMETYGAKHGKPAALIFLQNHGVFAGAENADGIKELYDEVMSKIGASVKRKPDFSDEKRLTSGGAVDETIKTLSGLAGSAVFMQAEEAAALLKDALSFAPVSSAFTPDHIVYAGSKPLFIEAKSPEEIRKAWKTHNDKTGSAPKIAAVKELGVFGAAAAEKAARAALDLFRDSIKIAVYAENFGGPLFMAQDKIDFINNWEAERFRSSVSTK